MKQLKSALFAFVLLVVGVATVAAQQTSATLDLSEPVTIAGTTLNPGHYKVKWQNSGQQATLTILSGKRVVATVPAQVTQESGPNADNVALKLTESGSTKTVTAVYTPKLTFTIDQNATASK
jgi:hypothetical protein